MEAHHVGVRELDLSACHVNTLSDKINAVPGLRTSTAFFTFLRANLVLSPSAMSSCANTPILDAIPSHAYQHPHAPASPSPLSTNPPLTPIDDIPPLTLEPLHEDEDKRDGLHLVADSVAEMRQKANRNLVKHPICLAGLAASLTGIYQFSKGDPGLGIMLACGATMAYLLAIRLATNGYISLAEAMSWSWLLNHDTNVQDILLGARFNGELVATLVLRLQPSYSFPSTSSSRRKKSGSLTLKGGKGIIRAWTTKLKYRGQGIGRDLLAEAVRFTKEKCGKDAEVGFAKEHANSVMVLPETFNGGFRRDEVRAAKALETALADWEASRKKR